MKWSRKEIEKYHWNTIRMEIDVFVAFVECFRRSAPGVRYYVNCTPEEDAETHKDLAKDVLKILRQIKNTDIGAYKTIVHMYKDDIRDAVAVYRESKGRA